MCVCVEEKRKGKSGCMLISCENDSNDVIVTLSVVEVEIVVVVFVGCNCCCS